MKTKEEILKKFGITKDSKFHDYIYLFNSVLKAMEEYGIQKNTQEEVKAEPIKNVMGKIDPRDWTEDFSHENGNYLNPCIVCGNDFFGHKRRVICKVCATSESKEAQPIIKFTWEKGDTFDSIYKKLLSLKGKQVINKKNKEVPLTIFNVSKPQESEINSWNVGIVPAWSFIVEYGYKQSGGITYTFSYNFNILKKDTYENDSKGIVIDPNHPFVFYK